MRPVDLSRIQAVLFDLDGLLVDTEPIQQAAFQAAARRFGAEADAVEREMDDKLHTQFVGKSDAVNAQKLIQKLNLNVASDRFVRERADIYVELLKRGAPLMPGAREAIRWASERGMKTAVGSSSVRRFVEASLNSALPGWRGIFGAVVCGDDAHIQARKPAPDIYLRCAELLEVSPCRCAALEDSQSGVESAARGGIGFIGAVPNAFTRSHDFTKAHKVMKSLTEMRIMG